jgi:alanyl-tRNA synthetase
LTHKEIRDKFIKFFEDKGHKLVPSSSLLPSDPSVLFTSAGMQQFKPYYTGDANALNDFGSLNTISIQKCMRTSDIYEVGDESHNTFLEMLGNFSFGGYFKEDAIKYAHEFITKEMNLKIDYVSIFKGADNIPEDTESEKIWKSIDPNIKIKKYTKEDNFWGPTGSEGPCGPTTEIYVDGVEIWNIVFNQYYCTNDSKFKPLKTNGIDTGMGLERLAMVAQKKKNIFETDLFEPIISLLPLKLDIKIKRIMADHMRAVVFLLADGIRPSNKEQGYVLRRLIRRIMVYSHIHNLIGGTKTNLINKIINMYGDIYPEIMNLKDTIVSEFKLENDNFRKTLGRGIKELNKVQNIDAKSAFRLFESFGLPFEIIRELGNETAKNLNEKDFEEEFKKHQKKSRTGAKKKFGGHGLLLDTGELKAGNKEELKKATRLHTATHLLHASLRKILGNEVKQAGSDITSERLRFDFTFSRKMTSEEIRKVENLINDIVKKDLKVIKEEMSYEDAMNVGALAFFKLKYPNRVNVYTIGPEPVEGQPFSRELCGGPHVSHTAEIGQVKITKEESVSAGTRRIRAIVS